MGLCHVRAAKDTRSAGSGQVRACEGAQGNAFEWGGSVRVDLCEGAQGNALRWVGSIRVRAPNETCSGGPGRAVPCEDA